MRDIASDRGELIEDTRDWYAQDVCGNIWYLGKAPRRYQATTGGSRETVVAGRS